jgi:branched-chain amino acid transport system substrate-binding protein
MSMRLHKIFVAALLLCPALFAFAEEGVTENTILIGQTIGVTGPVASAVKEMNEGANAYFATVNKQGGINGRKIELRILDDKYDPSLAAANAETLINKDHVFALFQSRGTPQTEAILPVLATNKVPLIAPSTGAVVFHKPVNHWVFNVRAKYQSEVIKAIEQFTTIGIKNIALLYYENDPLGVDGLEGFNKGMAAKNLKPATIVGFPRLKPDIEGTAAKLIKANPGALIIVSSGVNTVKVIKAIRAQGGTMQIMTLSNNSSSSFIKDLGSAGPGVIVSQITPPPRLLTTRLGEEFQNAAKATGATVSYAAMEGFVSAKVLVEGLRRAGRDLRRENFIRALESMRNVDLGGLAVNYGPNDHSGSDFVELTLIGRDGHFIR